MEKTVFGNMIYYEDKKYHFVELFDETTGFLARSNVIDNNVETEIQPPMRSFPELIDIGIMGSCASSSHGLCQSVGVDCYQNAMARHRPNMSLEKYSDIIAQCRGHTFQVALGGTGDPNKHESFEEVLQVSRQNFVIPNLTTSGFDLCDHEIALIKKYCGAVAVSYYSKLNPNQSESNPLTISAIERFVNAECITNIHFVLSKNNIKEATHRVKHGLFPKGINAVIFLLYKPVGQAKPENMLTGNDTEYISFLKEVERSKNPFKIGFDSCQSPALNIFCPSIAAESLEFCEAARFSMYIDCDLIAYPCSFGHNIADYSVNLSLYTVSDAWNSPQFELFRLKQRSQCVRCDSIGCRNCALGIGVNVCGKST